ncbi:general transcription factor 3C polypeptide 3 isoform X4 [Orcinus orca]|uniref:General transcription factor 3C polypeptide 3 isoform X4 n=1 Tax=Tursiops truncatus TaxID=9739 RepID=A0A2U4BNQ2_TURTR|nr:general transcription factor 3C polypeptide 3 isoform X4 [Tursiops truncatus]XP_026981088.1 general transcription factor 3C polypeptide 3 isoform X4 [Lagenorhynchus obliquidens]XP_049568096.1 general transcription factor 3C polypeptide 3 isoform X4 [Orcinus orca]XP_060007363.1 general transcription factor 3C polypeptide 3 isoform X4 [Lagenorhynchus albirostris]
MSGFSPELIDYLEGKISFEEFERRREERKTREKKSLQEKGKSSAEENPNDSAVPSSSGVDCTKSQDEDVNEGETSDGVSKSVHKVFASMLGENEDEEEEEDEEEDEEEETPEQPTAGDVFVLEMVLNRETKKMMKEKRPRSKLPRALRGLMGEANIRFARGEREEAILMCMEIIRQAPLAYEPFSTLAMIYEDQGDMEKSLQFELIAAHLNPSDTEEWVRLAEMSLEQDNIKQAIFCYTKALKYEPTNVRYLWERSSLYEQMGDHKMAMDGYRRILNLLSPSDGERFMQLSRDMAKSYYEANDVISAINIIEEAFSKHQGLVSMEDVNIAAELYISNKQYDKALEVITDFSGIVLEKKTTEEGTSEENKSCSFLCIGESGENVSCTIPDGVPIDITVKLMVCLVHLNILEPLNPLLTTLVEQNPEDMGDLYLDVAEAFLDVGEYNSALPLLSALVCSERYNLAVVWLRHAECLKALGYMERAAESYGKVVDLAPLHLDARISLSTLQQQLGRPEKALEALEPMYDPDTLAQDANAAQQELKLLLQRSTLLFSQGKMYGYVDTLLTMLAMLLRVAMNRAQVCLISSSKSGERHLYLIKVSRDKISDNNDQESANCDAKGQYVQAFRSHPHEPLYSLCIGLTFIHMASQKYVLKRHALIVQGFSFLNRYLSLRGPCQESFYNLGRGLHQLGLIHLAIHYYQKALELPPFMVEGMEVDQLDLRRDIAYNLSLIYQNSGNIGMAQKLLYTYCSI